MTTTPSSEPLYMVTERQLRALHNTYALNEGWPFGDGPFQWPLHVEYRDGQIHLLGECCNQAVWCLSTDAAGRGFTWNLELLKARVADHVLKVHPEAAT